MGIIDGRYELEIVRCVPLFKYDTEGENILASDHKQYPFWANRPEIDQAVQTCRKELRLRYLLYPDAIMPIPKSEQLPDEHSNLYLNLSSHCARDNAVRQVYIAGVGWVPPRKWKRRASRLPLILKFQVDGLTEDGVSVSLNIEPWEYDLLVRRTLERYPYLAAQSGDEVLGYACAGAFKERAAYDWSVETTIYLRQDQRGRGLGRALYQALERCLAAQHIQNLNACIADPAQVGDPYLTGASAAFHARLGYQRVGRFHKCGYKFGRWYDMIWNLDGEDSGRPPGAAPGGGPLFRTVGGGSGPRASPVIRGAASAHRHWDQGRPMGAPGPDTLRWPGEIPPRTGRP